MLIARNLVVVLLAAQFFMLTGCASEMRLQQLQRVAQEWCETIRASQVIPVYPLTEDLRPGDVFLVRTPIAEQHKEWKKKGFLVLDDHRVRLGWPLSTDQDKRIIDYRRMYFDGYFKDTFGATAGSHPRPVIANPGPLIPTGTQTAGDLAMSRLSTANAPRAAFPSYSFEVKSGGGGSLAVPVEGIPVALSFMQSGSASGIMTIADAYTYGADVSQLYTAVRKWAEGPEENLKLKGAAVQLGRHIYLRVISRVYLTGSVAVSLTNNEAGSASGKVGAAPDVSIFDSTGKVNDDYTALLKLLDDKANTAKLPVPDGTLLPGGAVKFAWASRRSVALNATFPTPLVVGYLGFDVPIDQKGKVGFPIPTWGVLDKAESSGDQPTPVSAVTPEQKTYVDDLGRLKSLAVERDGQNQQLRVMIRTLEELKAPVDYFRISAQKLREAKTSPSPQKIEAAWISFEDDSFAFVGDDGPGGSRAASFSAAFRSAFDRRNEPLP